LSMLIFEKDEDRPGRSIIVADAVAPPTGIDFVELRVACAGVELEFALKLNSRGRRRGVIDAAGAY